MEIYLLARIVLYFFTSCETLSATRVNFTQAIEFYGGDSVAAMRKFWGREDEESPEAVELQDMLDE